MNYSDFLIAIPAYRCEIQIRRVIHGLARIQSELSEVKSVVIFDNQSTDATFEEAEKQIQEDQLQAWVSIRKNKTNLGLGGTQKAAFDFARKEKYSHVIIFHGDDQGEVSDIPRVISELKLGSDAVLGSRFMKGAKRPGYSSLRVFGNRVLNGLYSILTWRHIEDLGSGLNGFKISSLEPKFYKNFSNQFVFNMDLLLYLVQSRSKFKFIPITWRELDQVSNARTLTVGWQAFKVLIYWRLSWCALKIKRSKISDV